MKYTKKVLAVVLTVIVSFGCIPSIFAYDSSFDKEKMVGLSEYYYEGFVYYIKNNSEIVVWHGDKNWEEIVIPGEINGLPVTTIESYAFDELNGLKSIVIPSSVKVIGDFAFRGCYRLESVTISDGIVSIGDYAFAGCDIVDIVIPDSVTHLGKGAFGWCENLKSITLSDNIDTIGTRTFWWCESLEDFDFPSNLKYIEDEAFDGCKSLNNLIIPEGVVSIGKGAFDNCTNISEIVVPDSVTDIENYTFYDTQWYKNQADGLIYLGKTLYDYKGEMPENTTIEIREGTVSISGGAFTNCINLVDVIIPKSVISIGDYAFEGCIGLTEIVVPNGVVSIGEGAFSGCLNLSDIEVSDSVTIIGAYAFSYTDWSYQQLDEEIIYINRVLYYYKATSNSNSIQVKDGTVSITSYAFEYSRNLIEVSLPDSLVYIGEYVFYNCDNLTTINFPESLRYIGNSAFGNCAGLTSLEFNEGLESIGRNAFKTCYNVETVITPKSLNNLEANALPIVQFSEDIEIKYYGYSGSCVEEYAKENYILFFAFDSPKSTLTTTFTYNSFLKFKIRGNNLELNEKLRVAIYDENDVFLDMKGVPYMGWDMNISFDDIPYAHYARIFVWDDLENMTPLTESETVYIDKKVLY